MHDFFKKYRLPLVLLLLVFLALGLRQGGLYLREHKAHSARRSAFDQALTQVEPENTAVSFRVPYDSSLFTPENIGLGQLDGDAQKALEQLLASMVYDREGTDAACISAENVQILAALPEGRMTISLGDSTLCTVDITRDGESRESAAYAFDPAARDALLACGGLPAIDEMKAAIESDLQNQILELGDSAKEDNKLK